MIGLAKQNFTAIAQSFVPDKKDVKFLSNLIRDNTKRYWKPLAAVGVVGALAYGAYKVRSEILEQREQSAIRPSDSEAESLAIIAGTVANRVDFYNKIDTMDNLQDGFLEEIEEALELEDCLENDPIPTEDLRWSDKEAELEIVEMQIDCENLEVKNADQEKLVKLRLKKCMIVENHYHKQQQKRQRKRVIHGQLSSAVKALSNKIRSSFPMPDGTQLQQKAMSLYAAKECRKMNMRESAIAELIPKAVTLASIPTTAQIDLRMITQIESVKLKYNKMAWSGYKNKSTWASKLVACLPLA
jgi:predicted transposase YbfD/YdcC